MSQLDSASEVSFEDAPTQEMTETQRTYVLWKYWAKRCCYCYGGMCNECHPNGVIMDSDDSQVRNW